MTTKELSLLDIFFHAFCGTTEKGQLPNCNGCEMNVHGTGCTHSENPNNKS
jgi:hypothetical protein